MTPLKKYRLLFLIKYTSIVLFVFLILSIPMSFIKAAFLPNKVYATFSFGFKLLESIGLIPSIILLIVLWLLFSRLDQHLAGYKGEALGQKQLRQLKKQGYDVFANMKLKHNQEKSEMDFIAIGANGIFIIEVKNIKGTIVGHSQDDDLVQVKRTKYNTYENKFYNPIKQVGTHVYKLSQYLKANHIHYWIEGYVYFPKKHSDIQVKNNHAIFSKGGKDLLKHIVKYKKGTVISKKEQEKIARLVNKYAVKI